MYSISERLYPVRVQFTSTDVLSLGTNVLNTRTNVLRLSTNVLCTSSSPCVLKYLSGRCRFFPRFLPKFYRWLQPLNSIFGTRSFQTDSVAAILPVTLSLRAHAQHHIRVNRYIHPSATFPTGGE